MAVTSTQEDFKVSAIKPVVINPSIFEGEFLIPSLYGANSAIAIDRFAPTNLTPPTLSGLTRIPSVLTCFPGIWSSSPQPDFTYQWYADGLPLVGQTSQTLTTDLSVDGVSLTCVVRAENIVGFDEIVSMNSISPQIIEPVYVFETDIYTILGIGSKTKIEADSINTYIVAGTGIKNTGSIFSLDIYAVSYEA